MAFFKALYSPACAGGARPKSEIKPTGSLIPPVNGPPNSLVGLRREQRRW
jgi:hypothetical protein